MDWWVWLLIGLGVLLVIGLVIFLVIRTTRKPDESVTIATTTETIPETLVVNQMQNGHRVLS